MTPAARSGPEQVDGDLIELDPAALAAMRGDIDKVDMDPEAYRHELAKKYVPLVGQLAGVKRHVANQEAQKLLRALISLWAGHQRAMGRGDSESYRLFYFKFGMDVMTAQALNTKESWALYEVLNECEEVNYDPVLKSCLIHLGEGGTNLGQITATVVAGRKVMSSEEFKTPIHPGEWSFLNDVLGLTQVCFYVVDGVENQLIAPAGMTRDEAVNEWNNYNGGLANG